MTIAELGERLGLPTRKIRYVFDQELMPGSNDLSGGRGVSRQFFDVSLLGIALAALLLEAGIRQSVVKAFLKTYTKLVDDRPQTADSFSYKLAFTRKGGLSIGDGKYVRWKTEATSKPLNIDTGWLALDEGDEHPREYRPMLELSIDVWALKQKIKE